MSIFKCVPTVEFDSFQRDVEVRNYVLYLIKHKKSVQ